MVSENIDEVEVAAEPSAEKGQLSDRDLLREYAATKSNVPFAEIVRRHMNWVYAAALRQSGNHAVAQDVTQAVFIILARKASSLHGQSVLSGWLFRAVRYAVMDAHKLEARRQIREQEASKMDLIHCASENDQAWEQMAPVLDSALAALGAKDRQAVLLRFFEKKSFGEIGAVLGGNENSARVRVVRAVEKLRGHFRQRGVVLSAVVISGVLFSQTLPAAPSQLLASLAGGGATAAISGTTAWLIQAFSRRLYWRRIRRLAALAICLLLMLWGVSSAWERVHTARAARQLAERTAAARAAGPVMIAIDRSFALYRLDEFLAQIHFRNAEDERYRSVLTNYFQAQSSFRREMRRVLNSQQRPFNVAFNELCVGQPPVGPGFVGTDRVSTNIMMAKYPLHLVKVGDVWKWDLFGGLTREAQAERMEALRRKAQLFESLSPQIHNRTLTNVAEILRMVQSPAP